MVERWVFPADVFQQGIILFEKGEYMDDLIYDAVSIFTQILQKFAPDRVDAFEFQLLGYGSACAFVLITMFMLYKLLSAFANCVLAWMSRGR